MKMKVVTCAFLSVTAFFLQGCIAFPPLIQVEQKDSPSSNKEVLRRLDAIDQRLSRLEQKSEKAQ